MDRHHSTLELFKHDKTARAPERDYDATAFELDTSALAPEVIPDTTPQVLYNSSFPEVHGKTEDPTKERASTHHTTKAALKWLWMVVALLVAAAIAIGVGVGTWRHREHSSKKPSARISPPAPQNHSITPAAHHILNDTSLAAVILPNGDRQLCFQDNTGSIRRAVRSASNNRWSIGNLFNASTGFSNGNIFNPKKYTPLAITLFADPRPPTQINLYYVSENNRLVSTTSSGQPGPPDPSLNYYSTAVNTRSLSVTRLPISNGSFSGNTMTHEAILYYENPTGNVSALMLSSFQSEERQWFDVSSQSTQPLPDEFRNNPQSLFSNTLYESARNYTFSTPFTARNIPKREMDNSVTEALFYSPRDDHILTTYYEIGSNSWGTGFSTDLPDRIEDPVKPSLNQNNIAIRQSDIATFGRYSYIWIDGTQPVSSLDDPPNNSFPFARLASVYSADQSSTFLYHQINDTTFAEEHWNSSFGVWLAPEYITIPD